jgi:hypothetical protein
MICHGLLLLLRMYYTLHNECHGLLLLFIGEKLGTTSIESLRFYFCNYIYVNLIYCHKSSKPWHIIHYGEYNTFLTVQILHIVSIGNINFKNHLTFLKLQKTLSKQFHKICILTLCHLFLANGVSYYVATFFCVFFIFFCVFFLFCFVCLSFFCLFFVLFFVCLSSNHNWGEEIYYVEAKHTLNIFYFIIRWEKCISHTYIIIKTNGQKKKKNKQKNKKQTKKNKKKTQKKIKKTQKNVAT